MQVPAVANGVCLHVVAVISAGDQLAAPWGWFTTPTTSTLVRVAVGGRWPVHHDHHWLARYVLIAIPGS